MKYSEAINYMYSQLPMFHRIGKEALKKDLTNIKQLCNYFEHPEKSLKCIHIAGTNGKGSVSHMLASVLTAHGYKTGLYVSPHYRDFRERIKIDGKLISKRYVSDFISEHKVFIEQLNPSFFEITVALAFKYFKDQEVDYAIIETGLGGRLDSTNIIEPILSVITNITWDHSDVLGDSLDKIAREKAGIIKKLVPVVIGRKQKETSEIFKEFAVSNKSNIYFAEEIVTLDHEQNAEEEIDLIHVRGKFTFIPDLKGPYQLENYRTAFAAIVILQKLNILPNDLDKVKDGFEHVKLYSSIIGRWELRSGEIDELYDSAHNEDGVRQLITWLSIQTYQKVHIVCGFVKDKDLQKVLEQFPPSAQYYFAQAKIPRALDVQILCAEAANYNLTGKAYKTVSGALKAARNNSEKGDLIIVTGSIFIVAEII
jgi:dihydrofolate synthase / folylpolyglutamate synthase